MCQVVVMMIRGMLAHPGLGKTRHIISLVWLAEARQHWSRMWRQSLAKNLHLISLPSEPITPPFILPMLLLLMMDRRLKVM